MSAFVLAPRDQPQHLRLPRRQCGRRRVRAPAGPGWRPRSVRARSHPGPRPGRRPPARPGRRPSAGSRTRPPRSRGGCRGRCRTWSARSPGSAGSRARIWPVASTPSPSGIRRSISTMSGRSSAAASTPRVPGGRLADHLQVRFRVQHAAQPVPDHRMVVHQQDPDHVGTSSSMVVPVSGSLVHGQPAGHLLGPGPHAGQPEAVRGGRVESAAVVADHQPDRILAVGQQHAGLVRPGMPADVGQRLLRGPEQDHLDRGGQRPRVAGHPGGGRNAGLPGEASGLPAYRVRAANRTPAPTVPARRSTRGTRPDSPSRYARPAPAARPPAPDRPPAAA